MEISAGRMAGKRQVVLIDDEAPTATIDEVAIELLKLIKTYQPESQQ